MSKYIDVEPALTEMRARVNSPSDARNHAEGWMAGFMAAEHILLKHLRRSEYEPVGPNPIEYKLTPGYTYPRPTERELETFRQDRFGTFSVRETFAGPDWEEKLEDRGVNQQVARIKETVKLVTEMTAIPEQVIVDPVVVTDGDVYCAYCKRELGRGDTVIVKIAGVIESGEHKAHYRCFEAQPNRVIG